MNKKQIRTTRSLRVFGSDYTDLVHRLKIRLNLLRGLSSPTGHTELMERSAISIAQ